MNAKCCRLCLSGEFNNLLDIYGYVGIELKMSEIIAEHFNCEVSELDSLPKCVCQVCWQTTNAFHELYEKSKVAQQKFRSSSIKIESDVNDFWRANKEVHYIEETQFKIEPIKIESNLDSNDTDQMGYNDGNASNDNSNLENVDDDTDPIDPDFETNANSTAPNERRWRRNKPSKREEMQFDKLFAENKHRFDMSCDFCTTIFETVDEARKHYAKVHKKAKGYIKCCNTKLTYPCNVVQHLQRHLEPNKFKCNECQKIYLTERELFKHMERHIGQSVQKVKTLTCRICKKIFRSTTGLETHMKRHKERDELEDGQYVKFMAENFDMKCDHCDTVFEAFHDARRHYKEYHNDDKGYVKCCNFKLRELCTVRDHVKAHLYPEYFKCEICNKNLSSRMLLSQHKRRHKMTMNKQFICDYCSRSFRDKNVILRHLFTNHVKSEPTHECEKCHKKFHLPILLRNHHYSTHREKKHQTTCEICGKSFYVKFHLDKHMLTHNDKSDRLHERKQCEWCGEWLQTKSGLYYHQQKHTSGIQKCQFCDMECSNKVALLGHIRAHHREHKFKCGYCDKTFPTSSTMKTHEESHTRHKVYQCKFCPRTFTVTSSRRTHTRRNHAEEIKRKGQQ